ncbi:transglycosylase SLT domain-containing protein [Roseovarius spongiae]|uniref:lytic transglycosylase domain-containing protein n=1 Tax=Roseovarius spongiae TaxID=2320272 RepID=UPI003CCC55DE
MALLLIALLSALPRLALAGGPDPTAELCDQAAQRAARHSGVPVSVLRAITRTETGRARGGKLQPWPWTVNMEGVGKWFATEREARAYVMRHYKRGARSFDVGCFQINYKWHGAEFTSIDAMFDPHENAAYAARFLKSLFAETGDWTKAAGAYHSRTPKYADRYEARFARIRKTVGGPAPPAPVLAAVRDASAASTQAARVNAYPLLQAGEGAGRFGSLVPLEASRRPALFVLAAQES